jgi:hypothetical protein
MSRRRLTGGASSQVSRLAVPPRLGLVAFVLFLQPLMTANPCAVVVVRRATAHLCRGGWHLSAYMWPTVSRQIQPR